MNELSSTIDSSKNQIIMSNISLNSSEFDEKNQKILYDSNNSQNTSFDSIECAHCEKKIFYKKTEKSKLNALNIKCTHCSQYFFISICQKCKTFNKIPKLIHEGELIKCLNNFCNNQYFQTFCPIKECSEVFDIKKHKIYPNLPIGVIYNHKSKLIFQKISCYHCNRPIAFITENEDKINKYYEAQKIQCPYNDCGKYFNRIICPKCTSVIIVELGTYIMGAKIKCLSCNYSFGKIYCVECKKLNPLEKISFKYGQFECRYNSCSKISHIANCVHCQRMNFFKLEKDKSLIQGIPIKCAYDDCQKIFSIVYCPSCHGANVFPKGEFIFGKIYKCKNKAICSKNFTVIVCSKCWAFSRINEDIEGKRYTCVKCNSLISNFECPFCFKTILDKDSDSKKGQIMKCPNCSNKFSFTRCFDCKKLIYYKENKTILGKSVLCKCGATSVNIVCPLCNARISISDRENNIEKGEKICCPNCDKEFEYGVNNKDEIDLDKEENIYFKNLSMIKILEGNKFNFGQGQVDENYLEKQKIFLEKKQTMEDSCNSQNETDYSLNKNDKDISKIEEQLKKQLCIICQCYEKQSIFFPCGHRCTCYKCALYYFEVFQKCPKCGQNAQAIIPKIYDS